MQVANLIVLTGALALPTLSGGVWAAEVEGALGALEQCGAFPEAGMRDCLAKKYQESTTALRRAEGQALVALSKWDEDAKYISLAKGKLSASSKAYQLYRDAQCAFAYSLGGGAIGNALELRRLSCLVGLNSERTKQLLAGVSELPSK
jgi:uncharacterized protein YecT (DUF1311 family)